ncbi:protein PHLOEM PROTEIN 2-LIKE A1-like isoform X2 [Quercus robur]|uniref:protein PHLOEM PROTEIN 2-LIKE A1-like isoform X2 n=1 Tax=Quercus robur TaxID=38942 RepID=UPI0021636C1F|nr:protein PHLOEM PROTEIN 2-LIKE A1-like isoform X2 [Quercus robur]
MNQIRVEAPDWQVAEIQQVEQTSSDETNSVEEMEMETDEIKQVEQNREANPVKGNELTTKRGTKPPLNFRAILTDKKIPMDRFDKSSPDELCKQLYAGVFLEPNALKYYVDEKLNKNCFVVFAKKLSISWIDQYWGWIEEKDTSGEVIEVAKLKELGVCWLNIEGKIRTIDLSPGTEYEVVFVVKMNGYQKTWKNSVALTIILPSSKSLTRSENLSGKPVGIWIDVKVGEFRMTPENVGEITFKLGEYSPVWKKGLVLKCAIIRPKNDQALGC